MAGIEPPSYIPDIITTFLFYLCLMYRDLVGEVFCDEKTARTMSSRKKQHDFTHKLKRGRTQTPFDKSTKKQF